MVDDGDVLVYYQLLNKLLFGKNKMGPVVAEISQVMPLEEQAF